MGQAQSQACSKLALSPGLQALDYAELLSMAHRLNFDSVNFLAVELLTP